MAEYSDNKLFNATDSSESPGNKKNIDDTERVFNKRMDHTCEQDRFLFDEYDSYFTKEKQAMEIRITDLLERCSKSK